MPISFDYSPVHKANIAFDLDPCCRGPLSIIVEQFLLPFLKLKLKRKRLFGLIVPQRRMLTVPLFNSLVTTSFQRVPQMRHTNRELQRRTSSLYQVLLKSSTVSPDFLQRARNDRASRAFPRRKFLTAKDSYRHVLCTFKEPEK